MRLLGTLVLLASLSAPALADSLQLRHLVGYQNTTTLKFKGPSGPSSSVVNKLSAYAAKQGVTFRASRNFLTGKTTVHFGGGPTGSNGPDLTEIQKIVAGEHVPEESLE